MKLKAIRLLLLPTAVVLLVACDGPGTAIERTIFGTPTSTPDIEAIVGARVKEHLAAIPTPTARVVEIEVVKEVVVEKEVIKEVVVEKIVEVPVEVVVEKEVIKEVTVIVEKIVEMGASVGETFTDDDGNFGLKFSSHSGYEKHVNYYDQNEHNYSYISDINFSRRGSFYQRFELRDGDCFGDEDWNDCDNNRERIELSSEPKQKPEGIQCFAYSIMLDKAFIDIHPTNTTLGQVHQIGGPSGTTEELPSFPPIIQIEVDKGRLLFRWHELSGSASNVIDIGRDYDLISLDEMKDKWTDISFCLNYKDKRMDVWINGIKKHEILKSPISFMPEYTYFKYGIYRSFISKYKQQEKMFERDDTLPTQIVFYDEVRRGNSIEEVDFNINPKLKPVD